MKYISKNTLKRLPVYLSYLKHMPEDQIYISATAIAESLKLGDVQVRKDLAAVSGAGRPKTGYDRQKLIETLEGYLGYDERKDAVLIGAGKLGMALFGYEHFSDYGLNIAAAFDSDIGKIGTVPDGRKIYHINEFAEYCMRTKVKIGIITVPAHVAPEICRLMIDCGIRVIWNFAPAYITVPDEVHVHNEDMAVSLAVLSGHLSDVPES